MHLQLEEQQKTNIMFFSNIYETSCKPGFQKLGFQGASRASSIVKQLQKKFADLKKVPNFNENRILLV